MSSRDLAERLIDVRQEDRHRWGVYLCLSRLAPSRRDVWLCGAWDQDDAESMRYTWTSVLETLIRCVGQQALAGTLQLEEGRSWLSIV